MGSSSTTYLSVKKKNCQCVNFYKKNTNKKTKKKLVSLALKIINYCNNSLARQSPISRIS